MRWLVGAIFVLVISLFTGMGLLAYAMYDLLGVMLLSRKLADNWSAHLSASREMNCDQVKIGDTVAVVITLENKSQLPVPWLLLEDLLPRRAMIHLPPNLQGIG